MTAEKFDYENLLFCDQTFINLEAKNLAILKLKRFIKVLEKLSPHATILDVACGVGTFTGFIKSLNNNFSVIGTDISYKALLLASKNNPDLCWVKSDVTRLPYQDNSVDVACGFDILEHVKNVDDILLEITRVLKPGGLFHFHIPCEGQPLTIWWLLSKLKLGGNLKEIHAGHIQRFTIKGIKESIESHGLKISEVKHSYHFTGQVLDFIQWLAVSVRRNNTPPGVNQKSEESGMQKQSNLLLRTAFGSYRFFIKILEFFSYYESRILRNNGLAMAIDVTAHKPI